MHDLNLDPVDFFAALPSAHKLRELHAQLKLPVRADSLYLAYDGPRSLRFAGVVVVPQSLDRPRAFCPMPGDIETATPLWRREALRQLKIATKIALKPSAEIDCGSAIWFAGFLGDEREVPTWMYALACIRVGADATGDIEFPRPFCPVLFQSMARQPEARRWLESNARRSPQARFCSRSHLLKGRLRQVYLELCTSKSEKQIAAKLHISHNTVKTYVKTIFRRYGVSSRVELISRLISPKMLDTLR